jgi:hypothetical protein
MSYFQEMPVRTSEASQLWNASFGLFEQTDAGIGVFPRTEKISVNGERLRRAASAFACKQVLWMAKAQLSLP